MTVSVVVDADAALEKVIDLSKDPSQVNASYRVALQAINESKTVVGDKGTLDLNPVTKALEAGNRVLRIAVAPKAGWGTGYKVPWFTYFSLATIALLAIVVVQTIHQQQRQKKRAQNQLRVAVETLPDGFVLYDADDRLVLCNSKYKEIYKKSAEVIVPGAKFEDILRFGLEKGQYKEAEGREETWLQERLAEHRASEKTIEQQLSDGRWLRILERATPDGGRVGLRIDITEQLESRERAERAERRLREAINALPVGFWLSDADERLVLFNDTFCKLYEKTAPAMKIGATAREIVEYGLARGEYVEAIGREKEWLEEGFARSGSRSYEREHKLQNGKWIRAYNRRTSEGGRVGVRVDITELKQQQSDLQASNDELRHALTQRDAAQKRFDDVAEITNDWFWEQDKDLRFTYISGGAAKLVGASTDFAMGLTGAQLYQSLPEVRDSADWDWLAARQAARKPFQDFVFCLASNRTDSMWVRISGRPMFDKSGEFTGYRGVGSDVSVLYNALQTAEAASLAKTEFLNVISHELRTPLTVILGYNAFLAKPDLLSSVRALAARAKEGDDAAQTALEHLEPFREEVARYAGKMQASGAHLLELINETLDLAKIDAGKMKVEIEEVSLSDVVGAVADQFAIAARQKSLELVVETHEEIVLADKTRLRQVLINLVGNAVKFTDRGSVSIRTEDRGSHVAVHVRDTGCGIPDEKLSAVFDQFSQIDSSATRDKGGTGLGLTISRRLVELQGGKITLESKLGSGSTFTFTIPRKTEDKAPSKKKKKAPKAA